MSKHKKHRGPKKPIPGVRYKKITSKTFPGIPVEALELLEQERARLGVTDKWNYTYLIINNHPKALPDECFYMGSHGDEKAPHKDAYRSSSWYVDQAIARYGIEFFEKIILGIFSTREQAYAAETQFHKEWKVGTHPQFMNRSEQEKGFFIAPGPLPQWMRDAISRGLTGRVRSADERDAISRGRIGLHHAPETCAKISSTLSDPNHWTQTQAAKERHGALMSSINTGYVPSDSHRQNLSTAGKKYHKSLTPEQKAERGRKIREGMARKKLEQQQLN